MRDRRRARRQRAPAARRAAVGRGAACERPARRRRARARRPGARARRDARQRAAGRAARAPGDRLRGGGAVPARRARRGERGDDRLRARAGAPQRAARRGGRDAADPGRRRPRRPGLRPPDEADRARVRARATPGGSRPSAAGRSRRTATAGAASSPRPSRARSSSSGTIRLLVDAGVLVVCAGGGGIPVALAPGGALHGVEAVIDKDLAAALLARGAATRTCSCSSPTSPRSSSTTAHRAHGGRAHDARRAARHGSPPGSMGPEGRGRLPLRRAHRPPGGDRRAGGCSRSLRRPRRHADRPARPTVIARTAARTGRAALRVRP